MRIKIWTSGYAREHLGPYKLLEIVERTDPLSVGENTKYGTIVSILPPILPFTEDADQSVVVELGATTLDDEAELPSFRRADCWWRETLQTNPQIWFS